MLNCRKIAVVKFLKAAAIFFALKKSLRPIGAAAEPSRSDVAEGGTAESGAFFRALSAVF